VDRVSTEIIESQLTKLNGWKLVNKKWLLKKYRFKSFLDSIAFVNEIAKLSEEKNHHPFISIDYTIVTLKLTSWKAGGITDFDLFLVPQYDIVYEKITN